MAKAVGQAAERFGAGWIESPERPDIYAIAEITYSKELAMVTISSPIHLAVTAGRKDVAELLLSNADVNREKSGGFTALDTACQSGQTGCIELLLAKGADINARNIRGQTPLDYAMTGIQAG